MHGLNEPVVALSGKRLAQPADVDVDGALLDVDAAAPDPIEKLAAGEDALGVTHEEVEHAEFRRSGPDRLPPAGDAMAHRVETQSADLDRIVVTDGSGPLQHRADPRYQLLHRERLDHVVVGARVESAQLVAFLALRGQHDERDLPGGVAAAKPARELQAAHSRQHPVEQDEIGRKLLDLAVRVHGIRHGARLETGPRERVLHHLPDGGLVLDQKYALAHRGFPHNPCDRGHFNFDR